MQAQNLGLPCNSDPDHANILFYENTTNGGYVFNYNGHHIVLWPGHIFPHKHGFA
jgi:hypothetical protein